MRAVFRGGPVHPEIPPPQLSDGDRELLLLTSLTQLGVHTMAYCRKCGTTQPFSGVNAGGLCFAHSLAERADQLTDDEVTCFSDPTLERLADDTEPTLSSERDTRDTIPTVDWAE